MGKSSRRPDGLRYGLNIGRTTAGGGPAKSEVEALYDLEDAETELVESSMGALSTDNIDALWKKVITQFKKGLLKGAYVINRNGSSGYYPNHWYTIGAKDAYERGVIIKPLAGENQYLLKKEDE